MQLSAFGAVSVRLVSDVQPLHIFCPFVSAGAVREKLVSEVQN